MSLRAWLRGALTVVSLWVVLFVDSGGEGALHDHEFVLHIRRALGGTGNLGGQVDLPLVVAEVRELNLGISYFELQIKAVDGWIGQQCRFDGGGHNGVVHLGSQGGGLGLWRCRGCGLWGLAAGAKQGDCGYATGEKGATGGALNDHEALQKTGERCSASEVATINRVVRTGNERCSAGGQPDHELSHLLGEAEATNGVRCNQGGLDIGVFLKRAAMGV